MDCSHNRQLDNCLLSIRQWLLCLLLTCSGGYASAQDEAGEPSELSPTEQPASPQQLVASSGSSEYIFNGAGIRSCDEVWEVNTRALPECIPAGCEFKFRVYKLEDCFWSGSDKSTLLDSCQSQPLRTIVYVHGNWMPLCDARKRFLAVYRQMIKCNPAPFRMVAISWPSEQTERFAKDVKRKKTLIETTAFYTASLVNQLPNRHDLAFFGYSFGASVVCGSLHLLGGGCLQGRILCETPPEFGHCFRVSLVAPAFDRTSLTGRGQYNRALSITSKMVNLYNSNDPILRRFRFFDRSHPVAAGFAGLVAPGGAYEPLQSNVKIKQYDCNAIGRTHWELEYHRCNLFRIAVANVHGE